MYTESEIDGLNKFLSTIYHDSTGYACVSLKHIENDVVRMEQKFFEVPTGIQDMSVEILTRRTECDVYFTPAVFRSQQASKYNVKSSGVVWVDVDSVPRNLEQIPPPDIRITSSFQGKEHWYWRLSELVDGPQVEKVNKSLAYLLNVDMSGWDAGQLLRPPYTFNYKHSDPMPVTLGLISEGHSSLSSWAWLPEAPESAPQIEVNYENLPSIEDLIFKYTLPENAIDIFMKGPPSPKPGEKSQRSEYLMQLGYELVQHGFTNEGALAMLLHADARWGKFSKRNDQLVRLSEIIAIARNKYGAEFKLPETLMVSFMDIINMEKELVWLIEGLLEENGNQMLASAPGVGKTQLTLQAAAHIALGKDFLGYKVNKASKIGFFSFEMDDLSLKHFLTKQAKTYSKDELELLHENFKIYPLGYSMALNQRDMQKKALDLILENDLQGAFFDSLSASTDASLVDDLAARQLAAWVNSVRAQYKKFTWWLHHNRKPSGENSKPKQLGDIYGSTYITTPLSAAMVLWPKGDDDIELSFVKVRLEKKPKPFIIVRDSETLTFTKQESPMEKIDPPTVVQSGLVGLKSGKLENFI